MRHGVFFLIIISLLTVNLSIVSATEIKFGENTSEIRIIDYNNGIFYMYGIEPSITSDEGIKADILRGEDIIIGQTKEGNFTYYYLPDLNTSYYMRDFSVWEDIIWVLIDDNDGIDRYITRYNMTSKKAEMNLGKLVPTRDEEGYGFIDFDIEVTADYIYTYCDINGEHICSYDKESLELQSVVKYLPEGVPDGKDNTKTISIDGSNIWAFHAGSRTRSSYGRSTDHPGIFLRVNLSSGERNLLLEKDPYDDWKEEYGMVEDIVYTGNTIYVLWDMGYMTSYSTDGAILTSEESSAIFPVMYLWFLIPIGGLWRTRKERIENS